VKIRSRRKSANTDFTAFAEFPKLADMNKIAQARARARTHTHTHTHTHTQPGPNPAPLGNTARLYSHGLHLGPVPSRITALFPTDEYGILTYPDIPSVNETSSFLPPLK